MVQYIKMVVGHKNKLPIKFGTIYIKYNNK